MVQCPKCSAQIPAESKFCLSCGQAVSSPSQMPTAEAIQMGPGLQTRPDGSGAPSPHVARIISSDSVPAGGFTPGTILADRYRIIGLLGRGGMGEVYRADDLKLGQPVALKFLPPKLAEDPVRRERFFAEVRITRQLSHPNICRVYDIGEIDGRQFLSMEFIDGEDLASLLKRIGHLTNEKALDIARQLTAGLAAAHERGVLHRDLKPANIMLDGHGRVRITDFGLAIAQEDESQAAEIAGTPAYMAPEQLAGKGATVRSDMYSLGLVLYEIYTGRKAFTATTLAELREQKETHTPRAISELREGMDPVVERLIRRCMEKDPNSRPASVAQLAQALPGGDPLAAALAAGETPSPEMVAASGSREGLRPGIAWALLALIFLGTLGVIWMYDRTMLHRRIPFDKPPEALAERVRLFLKKVGCLNDSDYRVYGYVANNDLLNYIENFDKKSDRWKKLDAKAVLFWYRQSPRWLINPLDRLAPDNPPMQFPGEVLVVLDSEGRLVSFRAIPQSQPSPPGSDHALDWADFLSEAEVDMSQWKQVETRFKPFLYADSRSAWQGSLGNWSGEPAWIEAASLHGDPISFEVMGPWSVEAKNKPSQPPMRERVIAIGQGLVLIPAIVGGIFFARRNLRLGRGDRSRAKRLGLLTLGMLLAAWLFAVPRSAGVGLLFFPYLAGLIWILYIAIEPFVRRRWPQVLVSWTRLLSGDWRDPRVARDALAGCALGVLINCILRLADLLVPVRRPALLDFEAIIGVRFFISELLISLTISPLLWSLAVMCLLFLLALLIRNQKAAFAAFILILMWVNWRGDIWSLATNPVNCFLYLFVLMRFGLLAIAVGTMVGVISGYFPASLDVSAWYAGYGYAALALFAAIVIYAFRTSLGGRPLLASSRFDD